MKNIDVVTAQKVDISYTLASLLQRILAYFIDLIAVGIFYYLMALLILALIPNSINAQEIYVYIIMLPIVIFYHLLFEYFWNGQTLGKKALGIRVIKINGERPEFIDYLTRWMLRTVDISFSMGIVAIISILANEKRQRLGDILSNTAVIQIQSARNYTLGDVLNIMKIKSYEVSYPNAKMFNEQQMLLVKETLERATKYENDAHIQTIKMLATKIADQLEVNLPRNYKEFLKVVLRDYIYLTR